MPITQKIFAENRSKLKPENPADYQEILDALSQPEEEIKRIIAELRARGGVVTVYTVLDQLIIEVFGADKNLTKINFSSFINHKQAKLIQALKIREFMAQVTTPIQAGEQRVFVKKDNADPTIEAGSDTRMPIVGNVQVWVRLRNPDPLEKAKELLSKCLSERDTSPLDAPPPLAALTKPELFEKSKESPPTPKISKPEVQPATDPNPFKEKNIRQYVTEFLGANSEELTPEQNTKLHHMLKIAKTSESAIERQGIINTVVDNVIRNRRKNSPPLTPKVNHFEELKELQKYIDAKTGTKEKPVKLRDSSYYGLLSNEQKKLTIAKTLQKNIQIAPSAVEQFLMIRKAMLANKKATGLQFGKGQLELILTQLSEEVLTAIKDPREKAVAELSAYILTIEAEKTERFFSIGRTDLDHKQEIAEDILDLLVYRERLGKRGKRIISWGPLKPIENITESYLNDQINENKRITHTLGKGEGREAKILTELFRSLFNKSPEIKSSKK